MKELRVYYERELGALHEFNKEFAFAYPAQAQRLGMADGTPADPHVERLIQATALSNARIAQLIDHNDAKVTEALLSVNYPHYLRPFPAATIVCFEPSAASTIPRGTMLRFKAAEAQVCKFQTTYAVKLAPIALANVKFNPVINSPASLSIEPSATSSISMEIECTGKEDLQQIRIDAWRLFIDTEQSQCAAIRDALFMHARGAYLELGDAWIALKNLPIAPVGFDMQHAMIPYKATAHPAFRLLTEYFAFPEKFHFIDIQWTELASHFPPGCRRLKLHLPLVDVGADTPMAHQLVKLSHKCLVPGCTPAVNLFKQHACPIELQQTGTDYMLMPDAAPAKAYDIFSVDKVTLAQGPQGTAMEFRPYYSLRHGEANGNQGLYYLVRRDPIAAVSRPGHEMRISFVDLAREPFVAENSSVSIELTCTNRDMPSQLSSAVPEGGLELEGESSGSPVRLLRRPSGQYRFGTDTHWRLISHLSSGPTFLRQSGLNGLKELLTLYDVRQSAASQRQIGGLAALEFRTATTWMRDRMFSCPVHGIEVRLSIDEDAFAGTGLHLFAQVLDYFFGLQVQINSFSQLIVLSRLNGTNSKCFPKR